MPLARVYWGSDGPARVDDALTLDPKLDPKLMFVSGDGWGIAVGAPTPERAHPEAIA